MSSWEGRPRREGSTDTARGTTDGSKGTAESTCAATDWGAMDGALVGTADGALVGATDGALSGGDTDGALGATDLETALGATEDAFRDLGGDTFAGAAGVTVPCDTADAGTAPRTDGAEEMVVPTADFARCSALAWATVMGGCC